MINPLELKMTKNPNIYYRKYDRYRVSTSTWTTSMLYQNPALAHFPIFPVSLSIIFALCISIVIFIFIDIHPPSSCHCSIDLHVCSLHISMSIPF
ncbi:hypothetical protein P691DRAFT_801730 [Macrolepiota fuliginosa MF-IS2]|uniref:Uncharacterized protein n=1 Tax=Macrolepiota fuliginosa MF-IS2 TaxID=1400762 RepID=A0A9P6C3V8_9AGAR|nr:hypothetical protein P691DRAFT_801730 [Macrolepiota fuliginosa MF-IS2]